MSHPAAGATRHLVVHPRSRVARNAARLDALVAALAASPTETVTVHRSRSLADVTAYVAACAADDVVAVVGGDGMLGAAFAGAARSGAVILPLPGGSGNDLCRHLRIPSDALTAARAARAWSPSPIDLLDVGGRTCVTALLLGYLQRVSDRGARLRPRHRGVYVTAAVLELFSSRPEQVTLTAGAERSWTGPVWFVAVASTSAVGGGVRLAPSARHDDGALELVVVRACGRPLADTARLVTTLLAALAGRVDRLPWVSTVPVRNVRIEAKVPGLLSADGEPMGSTPAVIRVRAGAARVLAPGRP
ncbi:hypothetical protein MM440_11980 [Arsenicicoccus piscis]|uniref:diacylglycerol/lipid kinase family protein n=1 Tax=Arsenicicoccus piscis TaxID=673954 RepID=UPI001F4CBE7E|nr:diacylglycerol kinase family protein [Arsenicicoccus piscis]MCH8628464.1 hypothetical protein [Arsenicicoccus piscis]